MDRIVIDGIVGWLRENLELAGARGCLVGLSGGVDSAVVAVLCQRARPNDVLGLIMPCFSSGPDIEDAQVMASEFRIPTLKVDLGSLYLATLDTLRPLVEDNSRSQNSHGPRRDLAEANLKARLRMLTLYFVANRLNYLVVGTGNRSEAMMGYFTKYGDGGVDLLPIGELLKSEVRELAEILTIPDRIIQRVPSAGLWAGQTDEGEMGITYQELDMILSGLESGDVSPQLAEEKVKKVKSAIERSEHKRRPAPSFPYHRLGEGGGRP